MKWVAVCGWNQWVPTSAKNETAEIGLAAEIDMRKDLEGNADLERVLHAVPAAQEQMPKEDIRATVLLDQLNAVDARAAGLKRWRAGRVPLSAVLTAIAMGMIGLSYRDPLGLLIYGLLLLTPLIDVIMRRRMSRSLLRERELVVAQYEDLLRLAAKYEDMSRDGSE